MSGIIDDVTSLFSSVGDTASAASDVASAASDAASTASDVASAASTASDAASTGFNFAADAANTAATAGDAISNTASYLDNAAAASYTAGVSTGSWGALDTGFNVASDASSSLASGSSYLGSTAYDAINNGQFNPNDFGGLNPNSPAYTNMALATASAGPSAAQANVGSSWWSKTQSMLGLGGSATNAATDTTGLGSLSKLMMGQMIGGLVSGAISAVGAYKASQPKPPANFSGRTPGRCACAHFGGPFRFRRTEHLSRL